MKCIGKRIVFLMSIILFGMFMSGCASETEIIVPYELEKYSKELYKGELYATNLCVIKSDVNELGLTQDTTLHGEGIFDLNQKKVAYAYNVHEQIYPASTTKILTALTAIRHGNLDDIVTVGSKATTELDKESSVAGLKLGDRLSLKDLLYGLMLPSGNDAAVAIAEHIGGNEQRFVELMNQEANRIGATNSHFTNSHGLHDTEHYTTVYDLYLFFQEALKEVVFSEITESTTYNPSITSADGILRTGIEWSATNYYATKKVAFPDNAVSVGGKTGNTNEAGSCLVFLATDIANNPYITIVMGADSKTILYNNMTKLITAIAS